MNFKKIRVGGGGVGCGRATNNELAPALISWFQQSSCRGCTAYTLFWPTAWLLPHNSPHLHGISKVLGHSGSARHDYYPRAQASRVM